jgi:hypothetical protein
MPWARGGHSGAGHHARGRATRSCLGSPHLLRLVFAHSLRIAPRGARQGHQPECSSVQKDGSEREGRGRVHTAERPEPASADVSCAVCGLPASRERESRGGRSEATWIAGSSAPARAGRPMSPRPSRAQARDRFPTRHPAGPGCAAAAAADLRCQRPARRRGRRHPVSSALVAIGEVEGHVRAKPSAWPAWAHDTRSPGR